MPRWVGDCRVAGQVLVPGVAMWNLLEPLAGVGYEKASLQALPLGKMPHTPASTMKGMSQCTRHICTPLFLKSKHTVLPSTPFQAEKDCEALRAEINRVMAQAVEQEAAMSEQRAEVQQLQGVIAEEDQVRAVRAVLNCPCLIERPVPGCMLPDSTAASGAWGVILPSALTTTAQSGCPSRCTLSLPPCPLPRLLPACLCRPACG
jgi:hypothetical protein